MVDATDRARRAGASVLESIAAASPTPSVHAGSPILTARELEVARLVATGATNRQIAAQLSISPKTVSAHVEHILTKLDAARRAEIAAWAVARARGPA